MMLFGDLREARLQPFRSTGPAHEIIASLRTAPICSVGDLAGAGNILIVAPHSDDETLGCGGLIAAAVRSNIAVLIDILTDGCRSHLDSRAYPPDRLAALRKSEARKAAVTLGLSGTAVRFHEQPDGYLADPANETDALVDRLIERIDGADVSAVFATCVADPHPDHIQAFKIAERAALRSIQRPRLYAYPIWMWTETGTISLGDRAVRAHRLDISFDLALKRRAIDCYGSQLGRVITDAREGFSLSENDIALFTRAYETFVEFVE